MNDKLIAASMLTLMSGNTSPSFDVPHHDATPNHEKHLASVMLEAEQKRDRKRKQKAAHMVKCAIARREAYDSKTNTDR